MRVVPLAGDTTESASQIGELTRTGGGEFTMHATRADLTEQSVIRTAAGAGEEHRESGGLGPRAREPTAPSTEMVRPAWVAPALAIAVIGVGVLSWRVLADKVGSSASSVPATGPRAGRRLGADAVDRGVGAAIARYDVASACTEPAGFGDATPAAHTHSERACELACPVQRDADTGRFCRAPRRAAPPRGGSLHRNGPADGGCRRGHLVGERRSRRSSSGAGRLYLAV